MGRLLPFLILAFLSANVHAATCAADKIAKITSASFSTGGRTGWNSCSVGSHVLDVPSCFSGYSVLLTSSTWARATGAPNGAPTKPSGSSYRQQYIETLYSRSEPVDTMQQTVYGTIGYSCVTPPPPDEECIAGFTRVGDECVCEPPKVVSNGGLTCAEPEPENPCEEKSQGASIRMSAAEATSSTFCYDGCTGTLDGPFINQALGGGLTGYFKYSDQQCSDSLEGEIKPMAQMADGTEGVCAGASSSPTKACVSKQKQNCGYVNGEYRCITSSQLTDENPCVQTASGAAFCLETAPVEAKPDNGTPGQPATPDAQFNLVKPGGGGMTVVNYYSSSTVNNGSENPGNDAGADDGGGDDGGGDGDGNGSGYGEGDGECTGTNCGTGAPGFGGVDDFGVSLSKFVNNVKNSQIGAAVGTLQSAVPSGGTLPSSCFTIFNQQYCFAVPEPVADAVRSILPLVMKAVWSIVAIMLFMKS